ncbi:MAG: hypothetical protein JXB04_01960 [Kiritimatiellae bacterium]|nr:hypothetical protein [Kiritimatiellia bacterium]
MTRATLHPGSLSEKVIGLLVLVALAAIGHGVYRAQFRFSPAVTGGVRLALEDAEPPPPPPHAPAVEAASVVPEGLVPMSEPEFFDRETLSDKIDGKADLYLSSGFVNLRCSRFTYPDDRALWMEVFLYDMGNLRQAFAVFSVQRRQESEGLDLAPFAYMTDNALFFVHDRYYVELVGSAPSERLVADMNALARGFIDETPAAENWIDELDLFPREGLVDGSAILYMTDGFGFHRLDNLFVAEYRLDGRGVTAFLSVRPSEADAIALVEGYGDYLIANGGSEQETAFDVPGARLIDLFGLTEMVFSYGTVLAGVHEAGQQEDAERLAQLLYDRISTGAE